MDQALEVAATLVVNPRPAMDQDPAETATLVGNPLLVMVLDLAVARTLAAPRRLAMVQVLEAGATPATKVGWHPSAGCTIVASKMILRKLYLLCSVYSVMRPCTNYGHRYRRTAEPSPVRSSNFYVTRSPLCK